MPVPDSPEKQWKKLEELQALFRLYRTYEFSDKLHFLTPSPQYGNLLNYVQTGILTWEEALQALLKVRG